MTTIPLDIAVEGPDVELTLALGGSAAVAAAGDGAVRVGDSGAGLVGA